MNFKLFFLIVFILASCGVKAPPLKHPDTVMQSYINNYTEVKGEAPAQVQIEEQDAIPAPKN